MTAPRGIAGLRLPVLAAPMFLVSGPELVIAACKAGIAASFPASNARDAVTLTDWLGQIIEACGADAPYALNINVNPARYRDQGALIDACEAAAVPLVITNVGNPAEIVRRVHGWGGRVFHDVTTVRHAEKAIEAGVDGLILVCAGAGGHSGAASAFALLPRVRQMFAGTIVLAGGIGTGSGILAAQALGADLVYMGTRFIASRESLAEPAYKEMVAAVDIADILYTEAISGLPANFMSQSIAAVGLSLEALSIPEGHRTALPEGVKAWKHVWSAGHAAGLVDAVEPVSAIVDRLEAEYRAARASL